jgi:conjugative transfer pilus assembly protein TraH
MKGVKKRIIAIAMAAALAALPTNGLGSWMDDWFDQKVSQSPSYFEGQKRGYLQGGSFSARWPTHTDSLMTVQPPTIKAGCGGIDVFTGGIGFLDFEYLVQKLQRVLQSAPGYAFQIGLKVLCEKCSSALEWITGISDALNGLQLDECKAGKALVAYAAKDLPQNEKIKTELAGALADFQLSTGAASSWKKIQDLLSSDEGKVDLHIGDIKNLTAGCPSDLQAVFFQAGSLLEHVGGRLNYPADHIALIRGIIGDIKISGDYGLPQAQSIPPCAQNGNDPYDALVSGTIYIRSDINSACTQSSDLNGSAAMRIQNMMISIAQKIENGQALTVEESNFIDANPLSIQLVLRSVLGTGNRDAMIALLADVTAKAYIYMSVTDLYARIYSMVNHMRAVKDAQGSGGEAGVSCNLSIARDVFEQVVEMPEKVQRLIAASANSYNRSVGEINTVLTLTDKIREFDNLAKNELQNRFHASLANRALGR